MSDGKREEISRGSEQRKGREIERYQAERKREREREEERREERGPTDTDKGETEAGRIN